MRTNEGLGPLQVASFPARACCLWVIAGICTQHLPCEALWITWNSHYPAVVNSACHNICENIWRITCRTYPFTKTNNAKVVHFVDLICWFSLLWTFDPLVCCKKWSVTSPYIRTEPKTDIHRVSKCYHLCSGLVFAACAKGIIVIFQLRRVIFFPVPAVS
jgi:hypothetical protein